MSYIYQLLQIAYEPAGISSYIKKYGYHGYDASWNPSYDAFPKIVISEV